MARLFVGQREIDFFSDISKEIIKDVAGQKIYYYSIREDLTEINEVYEESMEKIFNAPIEIECFVEWQPSEIKTTNFGQEQIKQIMLYMHPRDLFDRNISFKEGDYFSYGEYFFEATSVIYDKIAYGQVERVTSIKVNGRQARAEHINFNPLGPTSENYLEDDAIQNTFEQQRGTGEGDKRQLVEDGVLESPITGPKKVAPDGSKRSINKIGTSFYGDE
jgi:hypothetical protein